MSFRRIVLLALGLALPAFAGETQPLRVMSWNIRHGVGEDHKIDLERTAAVIRAAKPDLVTLQEVDNQCSRSGKVDDMAELARLTGMVGIFGKAMDLGGGAYGQGILSRFPISSSQVIDLPGGGEPRIAFKASIKANGTEMTLVSVHLECEDVPRKEQSEFLSKELAKETKPLILCGDFNADGATCPEMKVFSEVLKYLPKKAPTMTFPSPEPNTEIDHFLYKGFVPVGLAEVLPEKVASDHRPVLAIFRPGSKGSGCAHCGGSAVSAKPEKTAEASEKK